MRVCFLVLLILALFSEVFCECDKKCAKLKADLKGHNDSIREEFNDILDKYNMTYLEPMLNNLNGSVSKSDNDLEYFKQRNNEIHNTIETFNNSLLTMWNGVERIDRDLDKLKLSKFENKNISDVLNTSTLPSEIAKLEQELYYWSNFSDKIENELKNLTNLPHSTADEIALIESLLEKGVSKNCFSKFDEDLKSLFRELAGLIDFENVLDEITELQKNISTNRGRASEILEDSENIKRESDDAKVTLDLANEILNLAEDIHRTSQEVETFLQNADIFVKLKQLMYSLDNAFEELLRKYDKSEFVALLDKLKDISSRIHKKEWGDIEVQDFETEVVKYLEDIHAYTKFIQNCQT